MSVFVNITLLTAIFASPIFVCMAAGTVNNDQKYFDVIQGHTVVNVLLSYEDVSLLECAMRCMHFRRNVSCDVAGYVTTSRSCKISADNVTLETNSNNEIVIRILNMCGPSEEPEFGTAVISLDRTLVMFTCNPGYQLVGNSSAKCVQTVWVGAVPTCQEIDECMSSPCLNGATCIDHVNRYSCACVPGWAGIICETDIDECASFPCMNGGTCQDLVNDFSCTCASGFTGKACDRDVDECISSPCLNGATCLNLVNEYNCACASGWTGVNCETDIDECASFPCINGGTCQDLINDFSCTCVSGYTGKICDQDIDECVSLPCQNGGTCTDGFNGYTCACAAGFSGTNCATNINECASNPCLNGGVCADSVNQYSCACAAGFEGMNCEINIDECASSPCQNGGVCNDGVNGYTCACASVTKGVHCEIHCFPTTPWAYDGTKSTTKDGITCQRWDSQSPHAHAHTDLIYFPETTLSAANNYCRNPEPGEYPPWCMTTSPSVEWDYCGIDPC